MNTAKVLGSAALTGAAVVGAWIGNRLLQRSADSKSEAGRGAKSAEEYDKHVDKHGKAVEQLGNLEQQLGAAKGPKAKRPIQQKIDRLRKEIKGHEKEMRQKWPEGHPGN